MSCYNARCHRTIPLAALLLLVLTLLTCSPRNELFNNPVDAVKCYAFICDTTISAVSKIGDTIHFSTRDTIHTQDSVTFVGIIYPLSDKIKKTTWTISDGTTGDREIVRKKFSKGGIDTAIFTIEDNAGLTMSDTVVVCVNTAPPKPQIISPLPGVAIKPDPNNPLKLKWSCWDPDGDTLRYKIFFSNSRSLGIPSFMPETITDPTFEIASSYLEFNVTYFWLVKAIDKYGDTAVSDTFSFRTKNPNATTGILQGVALFAGWQNHSGIIIGILGNGMLWQYDTTDSRGNYRFDADPKTYTIVATDDIKKQFTGDTTTAAVTIGDETTADTLVLRDLSRPVISNALPIKKQSIRKPAVTAHFTDIGSGILVKSARLLVNDSDVTPLSMVYDTGIIWIPDARLSDRQYSIVLCVKDSAGNASDTMKWSFSVDAMKLTILTPDTTVRINDTVRIRSFAGDVFSKVSMYKWDFDGNGTWDDSLATADTLVSRPHAYSHEANYNAIVYARDDSGMVKLDTVIITVGNAAPVISSLRIDTTISIKDSIRLFAAAVDNDGMIKEYAWDFEGDGTFEYTNPIQIAAGYRYNTVGVYKAVLRVTDDDGKASKDTAMITVIQDVPVPNAGNDTIVSIKDTVRLHGSATQQFGTISEWAWDIGNTGTFKVTSSGDTAIIAPAAENLSYHSVLRVTDEDGNVAKDTVTIIARQDKPIIRSISFDTINATVRCSVYVIQEFGTMSVLLDTSNNGNFITLCRFEKSGGISFVFPITFDSVKIRVADDDGNVEECWFNRGVMKGSFNMGEIGIAEPVHLVHLVHAFAMDVTEVTQGDFQALMGVNPSYFTGDLNRPVEKVTWFDAVLYCNARSKHLGLDTVYSYTSITGTPGNGCSDLAGLAIDISRKGYRLPTEAEWEYSCRNGTFSAFWWGADTNGMGARTWSEYNSGNASHPVASKAASMNGLFDMTGNVWEWCNDWYGPYTGETATDPTGPPTGIYRIMRGGSWHDGGNCNSFHSACRNNAGPTYRDGNIGFRCVLPK